MVLPHTSVGNRKTPWESDDFHRIALESTHVAQWVHIIAYYRKSIRLAVRNFQATNFHLRIDTPTQILENHNFIRWGIPLGIPFFSNLGLCFPVFVRAYQCVGGHYRPEILWLPTKDLSNMSLCEPTTWFDSRTIWWKSSDSQGAFQFCTNVSH